MKIQSKYLKGDIASWVAEDKTALFVLQRSLARQLGVHNSEHEDDWRHQFIVDSMRSIGKKAYTYFDVPETGILWYFSSAVEWGLRIDSNVLCAILKDVLRCQQSDGGFTRNWAQPCSTACITGQMVYDILRCGYCGPEAEKGITWIIKNQRHDGGWLHCPIGSWVDSVKYLLWGKTGKGIKLENTSVSSCAVATVMCVKALGKLKNNLSGDSVQRAIAFLFNDASLFKETGCKCRLPYNHELLGYPYYLDYDSIDAINVLSLGGGMMDTIQTELFNRCMEKQFEDGSFPLEHKRKGGMHHFAGLPAKVRKPDVLTTVRVLAMLHNTGNAVIE